jgi:hypothetical protein
MMIKKMLASMFLVFICSSCLLATDEPTAKKAYDEMIAEAVKADSAFSASGTAYNKAFDFGEELWKDYELAYCQMTFGERASFEKEYDSYLASIGDGNSYSKTANDEYADAEVFHEDGDKAFTNKDWTTAASKYNSAEGFYFIAAGQWTLSKDSYDDAYDYLLAASKYLPE